MVFPIGFPGHKTTVEQVSADGAMVTVLHTHHATNTGEFLGMPPTGRTVAVHGLEAFRLRERRIAEFWRHDDDLGLMVQLGVVKLPGM